MPALFLQDEKWVYATVTAHSHLSTSLGFFPFSEARFGPRDDPAGVYQPAEEGVK